MRLIFLALPILYIWSAPVQSQEYIWPTDAGNYLSSTFGETRARHFHAGLDIKTWGREGYRVFAARQGKLHRLLVTERGYGKAIYLEHPDGSFTVYAHLQRFNNQLQALADSLRLLDHSFEIDARFDSLNIEVEIEQGELIGYTGSTGIGPPHLHFEIRDSLGNPVNALTTNLTVKDELPPVFTSIMVEPLEQNSRVNGKPVSFFTRQKVTRNGVFDFGRVRLNGKAGLAVNVYDRANEVYNAYAIYSLALLHEGDTLFYQELNSFSYDETGEMYLDRIAPFGSTRRGHHRLHPKDGAQNPFHQKVTGDVQIQVHDTARTYTIAASDYFGNTSIAQIIVEPDSAFTSIQPNWQTPPKEWYWSENWASPDLTHTIDLGSQQLGFPWTDHQQILFLGEPGPVTLARIYPGSPQKVSTPDRRFRLRFPENTFFDTLSVTAAYTIARMEGINSDSLTAHLSAQPQMLAAKSVFGIEFYLGDLAAPNSRYRLFRKSSSGRLFYVDSKQLGSTVHGYPSQLGEFVIAADNEPPGVSGFRIKRTNYGQWLATARAADELSGINAANAQFYVNGKRGIAEYDYEEKLLIYYLPGFKPEAENTAEIYLEDRAGNGVSVNFRYVFD